MKKVITIIGIFGLILVQAQVGINQDAPNATLDIKAETANTTEEIEGLLVPRVSKNKAFLMAGNTTTPLKESTLVYIDNTADYTTTPVATSVADITEKGYYFWNGDNKWVKTAGKDGAEWVYDPTTKQINLKRSGTAPFTNMVYFDEKGSFRNVHYKTYEVWNYNTDSWYSVIPSPNNIYTAYSLSKLSSDLKPSHSLDGKTIAKNMSLISLLFDETLTTGKDFLLRNFVNSTIIPKGNTSNITDARGAINIIEHNGSGDIKYLIGSSSIASLLKGTSTGYLMGNRSTAQAHNGGESNEVISYGAYTNIGKATSVNNVNGYYGQITYEYGTTANIGQSAAIRFAQISNPTSNPTITSVYGLLYDGYEFNKGSATITNHYGVFLKDIDKATNNYAIYTNKGKVRLGDDVSIGTTAAPKKLEVSGAIKIGSNSTASSVPVHVAPAGTIIFHNSSFYGNTDGTATGWKKLHN